MSRDLGSLGAWALAADMGRGIHGPAFTGRYGTLRPDPTAAKTIAFCALRPGNPRPRIERVGSALCGPANVYKPPHARGLAGPALAGRGWMAFSPLEKSPNHPEPGESTAPRSRVSAASPLAVGVFTKPPRLRGIHGPAPDGLSGSGTGGQIGSEMPPFLSLLFLSINGLSSRCKSVAKIASSKTWCARHITAGSG